MIPKEHALLNKCIDPRVLAINADTISIKGEPLYLACIVLLATFTDNDVRFGISLDPNATLGSLGPDSLIKALTLLQRLRNHFNCNMLLPHKPINTLHGAKGTWFCYDLSSATNDQLAIREFFRQVEVIILDAIQTL